MSVVKVAELSGAALDWAVAKCESEVLGEDLFGLKPIIAAPIFVQNYKPSTDWAQGGPIIEREKISIMEECNGTWMGSIGGCTDLDMPLYQEHGPTPLIATMRCYVTSKLGEEIEVPEELK